MNGSNPICKQILQKTQNLFQEKIGLFFNLGIELEFYLLDSKCSQIENSQLIDLFIEQLNLNLISKSFFAKKERGHSQIEIATLSEFSPIEICDKVEDVKLDILRVANDNNFKIDFTSQPFRNDCGSAFQVNFSIHNSDGKNLLELRNDLFFYSIAGMIGAIEHAMFIFAPKSENYLRFDREINQDLFKKGKFTAPVNISFGNNNRTAAIRAIINQNEKRIEFRIPSADANPYLVVSALIIGIANSILNQSIPDKNLEIFGNAFDSCYDLPSFANNLNEARRIFFSEENFIKNEMRKLVTPTEFESVLPP